MLLQPGTRIYAVLATGFIPRNHYGQLLVFSVIIYRKIKKGLILLEQSPCTAMKLLKLPSEAIVVFFIAYLKGESIVTGR